MLCLISDLCEMGYGCGEGSCFAVTTVMTGPTVTRMVVTGSGGRRVDCGRRAKPGRRRVVELNKVACTESHLLVTHAGLLPECSPA